MIADLGELAALGDLCRSLLAAMRALLDGFEPALAKLPGNRGEIVRPVTEAAVAEPRPLDATFDPDPTPPGARRRPSGITLSAGPFDAVEAIEEFQVTLAMVPGVSEVAFRGYEGSDRAIIDIELDGSVQGAGTPYS